MKTGRFLVTHAEAESAVVRDVEETQVLTLGSNPGVEEGDVLDATLEPEPPLEVTWTVVEVEDRRTIPVERSDEPPTKQERDIAAEQDVGDLTKEPRAGIGEIHVLTVPEDETDDAAADVVDDEATVARAARLDVNRVEVRAEAGVVAVRYLP
ncbi:DUF5812 family protein [Haloarculaceae archaeon H-GB1-1]|nr:DUF5812 family protein [Haloarculaceae archaeon H-GB1-1]